MPKQLSSTDTQTSAIDYIQSYQCHGVDFASTSGDQAIGHCIFCDKDSKFHINRSNGLFDCKSCGLEGNLIVFLRHLYDLLSKNTEQEPYLEKLANSRGLLSPTTLSEWGLVRSYITGTYLIPGFNAAGEIVQLYRYVKDIKTEKKAWYVTPGLTRDSSGKKINAHGIFWYIPGDPNSKECYVCEGCFDGMTLSEILGKNYTILAVPGGNVFQPGWCEYMAGKDVFLLYDNDHLRTIKDSNGKIIRKMEGTGIAGVKRASSILSSYKKPPTSISYLHWGDGDPKTNRRYTGYDPELKSGYDISDYLREGTTLKERKKLWSTLSQKVQPVPKEWIEEALPKAINIEPKKCTSWKDLVMAWRKSGMLWPDSGEGLDYGLSILLAADMSTATQGELVWLKLRGPASSGKSVLAEGLAVAKRYVKALSTLRGFYSGYRVSKNDDEDSSLIAVLDGKTLIIKDGDTLAKSAHVEKVLAEARDLYDGFGRSHYNNRMGKDYEYKRFTFVVCGTETLAFLDRSELGERMLDVILMDGMEPEVEDEIGWLVAMRANEEVSVSVNGVAQSFMTEGMLEAKSMTGGYVEYLRQNAEKLIRKVRSDDKSLKLCQHLATFASFMRTKLPLDRGKGHPEIKAQRELSFRLISQHVRLARCLAAVLNKTSYDEDVMRRVRKVGLDTSRGPTLDICHQLYPIGDKGLDIRAIALLVGQPDDKTRNLIRFLARIHVVETAAQGKHRIHKQIRWKLTDRVRRLYEIVVLEK